MAAMGELFVPTFDRVCRLFRREERGREPIGTDRTVGGGLGTFGFRGGKARTGHSGTL